MTSTDATLADSISLSIVDAVAEAEDADPATLDPPLGAVVDAGAIDRLFSRSTDGSAGVDRLTLTYYGYEITVEADGTVDLE
jgi:hypothetical protein